MKKEKSREYLPPLTEVMAVASEGLLCTSTKTGFYNENPDDEQLYVWED